MTPERMTPEQLVRLIDHVQHTYDPVKAHEYYMRTRVLKGRPSGSVDLPSPESNGFHGTPAKGLAGQSRLPPKPDRGQLEKHARDRTEILKSRIAHLKAILERLVAEAKRRSGVETPEKKPSSNGSSPAKEPASSKPSQTTAKERQQSKKYYEEHKKPAEPSKPPTDKELQKQIEQLTEKIRKIRRQLKQAVSDARPNPGAGRGPGQHISDQRRNSQNGTKA